MMIMTAFVNMSPKVKVLTHTAQYAKNGSTKALSAFDCALSAASRARPASSSSVWLWCAAHLAPH